MMWTLVLMGFGWQAGAGTPAGSLTIEPGRPVLGIYGSLRGDARWVPGELISLAFDIGGLQPSAEGRYRFTVNLVLEDASGKAVFADDADATPLAGGAGKVRHFVQLPTGLDQAPGRFKLKLAVQDRVAKRTATATQDLTLAAPEFALVRPQCSLDPFGQVPAPAVGVVGQTLHFNWAAVHFKTNPQADAGSRVRVEVAVVDGDQRPTGRKPSVTEFTNLESSQRVLPLRYEFPLERPGQFKIVVKATDVVAGKSAELILPVWVADR